MHPWVRWREPLAVVLLVALTLMLVVRGVALGVYAGTASGGGLLGSIPGGDELLLLATAAAVLWCSTPAVSVGSGTVGDATPAPAPVPAPAPTPATAIAPAPDAATLSPHAWPIALAGLVVVGLTVFGWLTLSALNIIALLRWPTPDTGFVLLVAEGLVRLAIPLVSFAAVIVAAARAATARRVPATGRRALAAAGPAPNEVADTPDAAAPPERLPAAWRADEATGAVWLTADDAAEGRPGLSWSEPSAPDTSAQRWTPAPSAGQTVSAPGAEPTAQQPTAQPPTAQQPTAQPNRAAAEDDDLR